MRCLPWIDQILGTARWPASGDDGGGGGGGVGDCDDGGGGVRGGEMIEDRAAPMVLRNPRLYRVRYAELGVARFAVVEASF